MRIQVFWPENLRSPNITEFLLRTAIPQSCIQSWWAERTTISNQWVFRWQYCFATWWLGEEGITSFWWTEGKEWDDSSEEEYTSHGSWWIKERYMVILMHSLFFWYDSDIDNTRKVYVWFSFPRPPPPPPCSSFLSSLSSSPFFFSCVILD
jgi:hypothetical protein